MHPILMGSGRSNLLAIIRVMPTVRSNRRLGVQSVIDDVCAPINDCQDEVLPILVCFCRQGCEFFESGLSSFEHDGDEPSHGSLAERFEIVARFTIPD